MLNIARGILISVALVLVCWWALQGSPTFQACMQQEQKQSADNHPENYISVFIARADAYRDCVGEFVHDKKDEILVAFTVILAFSTVFLWVATRDLVSGAERTSRQQLRAYVFAGDVTLEINEKTRLPVVVINVKNVGQTPAYETTILRTARTFIGNEIRSFPTPTRSKTTSKIDLGQGVGARGELPVSEILNQNGLNALKTGDIELFVFGVIKYKDIFGTRRETRFRFLMGGHYKWPSDNRLLVCDDGNKAT